MKDWAIRLAAVGDLPQMLSIYEAARNRMHTTGNPHQWVNGYPSEDLLREDMAAKRSFVVEEGGRIIATFVLVLGEEPTYGTIYEGTWLKDNRSYATIHRIASDGKAHGVLAFVTDWARRQSNDVRVDTHRDNAPMRAAIAKCGFRYCGIIHLANGDERLAYQNIRTNANFNGRSTSLCYLERDGQYLVLHRTKKAHDENGDKWIGVGGKFEPGETPDECALREVREETGLTMTDFRLRGLIIFVSNVWGMEYMYLYTATKWRGKLIECDEGELVWLDKRELLSKNLWEGDKLFLKALDERKSFFIMKLRYEGEKLVEVVDSKGMSDFRLRVYMELLNMPRGSTVTYGELARRLGCGSAQAVGQALRHNPFAPEIPCHRVVAADGSLGGYGGSRSPAALARKRKLLESERQ